MKFRDILRKIVELFKGTDIKKRDYNIKTANIHFFDIPRSVYLVIKKYGWLAFFGKSITFLKLFFKEKLPAIFKKIANKISYLAFSFRKSHEQEGFGAALARTVNYAAFGKGTLGAKKIQVKKEGFQNRYQKIADKIDTSGLRIGDISEIAFKNYEHPEVSIIIPVFNKWQYTHNCLKSLKQNVKGISFEVIVVDNASTDETPQLFEKIKNVDYVRNEKNLNFVGGNNQGFQKARGEYIVCLNNDTFVLPGWLEALKGTFEKNKNIGLVGSKLIYPDGRLQEAGGIIWRNESAANWGKFSDPDKYEFNYLKDVDYCSAASIMVRADVIKKLNGFDVIYHPAFFEDTDLAFRVRKLGLRTIYQPKSEVIHFEGITAGRDEKNKQSFKKFQEVNKKKFFERWKKTLEEESLNDKKGNIFLARDRSQNKKVMLFVDNNVPTFDQDAGSFIAFEYLKIFLSLGYKIVFWPHNLTKLDPYTENLQQLGIEVVYGDIAFSAYIRENGKYFDLALVSRPNVSQFYIDPIRAHSQAKILYMAHDLHFLREMRAAGFGNVKTNPDFKKTKKTEIDLMRKSDATLVFSDAEEKIIKRDYPDINIETTPWIEEVKMSAGKERGFATRSGLLFLGGFGHPPNGDALLWFHGEILPLVKEQIPEISVTVLGSKPTEEIKKLDKKDFRVVGFVEEKELPELFSSHRIFVSPLRFGAGFKGKNAKSMSFGLPLVTTTIGAEGIGIIDRETGLIADTAEEFARAAVDLCKDEDLWNKISEKSIEHTAKNYSAQVAKEKMKKIIDSL